MKITIKRTPDRLWNILIAMLLLMWYGHPITSFIPVVTGINSTPFNFGSKLIFIVVGLFILYRKRRFLHIKGNSVLFGIIIFWILYGIRLYYDFVIRDITNSFGGQKAFLYGYLFCFIPFIITALSVRNWNFEKFNKIVFYVLLISNAFSLLALIYTIGSFSSILEVSKIARLSLGQDEQANTLDPIRMGSFGQVLLCVSIINLLYFKVVNKLFLLGGIGLGAIMLFLGGSRGPILTFVLMLIFIGILYFRTFKLTYRKILRFLFALTLILFFFLPYLYNAYSQNQDFTLFERVTNTIENRKQGKKEARDYEWEAAWEQFLDSPIIGDAWLNSYDNFYPHNIYLEVLMALGFIGGGIFFYFFFKSSFSIVNIYRLKKSIYFNYVILGVSAAIFHVFSGGIYTATSFWVFMITISLLPNTKAFN